ncbi:hypothetical protein BH24CHL4_BH24CHL4_12220 [soil metagenome]
MTDPSAGSLITDYQRRLLSKFFVQFYETNGRVFPWRSDETTPFHLLLAEMLLRQTQAEQVLPCWRLLTERVQSPNDILRMTPTEIRGIVAPLGLANQRIDALISCSTRLVTEYGGVVPVSLSDLTALPHIGSYTASAVACFGFGARLPIVDGNVLRVLSRITNRDLGRDNRRSPLALEIAWSILPKQRFREHNLGLLDFAAIICTSRKPVHTCCGLRRSCNCLKEKTC